MGTTQHQAFKGFKQHLTQLTTLVLSHAYKYKGEVLGIGYAYCFLILQPPSFLSLGAFLPSRLLARVSVLLAPRAHGLLPILLNS